LVGRETIYRNRNAVQTNPATSDRRCSECPASGLWRVGISCAATWAVVRLDDRTARTRPRPGESL